MKIWSISQSYELKQEKVLQGHQRWVWDCAFSADSAYLVTGEELLSDSADVFWCILANSIFGSHRSTLGDGFGRDCPTVQWTSQGYVEFLLLNDTFIETLRPAAVCCALHDGAG